jgi:Family of unknown function (DUF5343)
MSTTAPIDPAGKSTPAAYVSFRTFLSAIDALGHGIPKQIDRTIWRSQSGVVQSQIMMALRFFNLVDEEDRPTQALHRFVDASPDKRPEQIASLLRYAYRDILDHDLTKMTPRMLEGAMENYHVSGDTKRKAVTFFLQAARFAELPMHPLLHSTIRKPSAARKKRTKADDTTEPEALPTNGTMHRVGAPPKIVSLRSGGTITLIVDVDVFAMSPEDRTFVFGVIDTLQKYEKDSPS